MKWKLCTVVSGGQTGPAVQCLYVWTCAGAPNSSTVTSTHTKEQGI